MNLRRPVSLISPQTQILFKGMYGCKMSSSCISCIQSMKIKIDYGWVTCFFARTDQLVKKMIHTNATSNNLLNSKKKNNKIKIIPRIFQSNKAKSKSEKKVFWILGTISLFLYHSPHTMNYPKKQDSICTNRGIVPI